MTVLNLQVNANADDGQEEDNTTWYANGHPDTGIFLGNGEGVDEEGGFRYTGVSLPNSATIDTATMQLYGHGAMTGTPLLKILADDVDDAVAWSSSSRPSQITATTAQVDWDPASWTNGGWNTSPEIKTIIQEIADRGGWSSGNDLRIAIWDDGSSSFNFADASDYTDNSSQAAKLDITYTSGGRTTKNTDSHPLGMHTGMAWRVNTP